MTPRPRSRAPRSRAGLLVALSGGGMLGSLGRYAVGLALPHAAGAFAWSTLLVNVTGSLAMGVLVVWVLSMDRPHPLLRPFLGVGVLGGWTTFSSFTLDARTMVTGATACSPRRTSWGRSSWAWSPSGSGSRLGERAFGPRP